MAANTPAPWEVVKESGGGTWAVFGPGRDEVIGHLLDIMPEDVVAANAKLIQAAPDLLAACRMAAEFWAATDSPIGAMCRAAVDKATYPAPVAQLDEAPGSCPVDVGSSPTGGGF